TKNLDDSGSKQRVMGEVRPRAASVNVRSLFFLSNPNLESGNEIRIDRIGGAEAMMTLVKRSFILDVGSKASAAGQFRTIEKILNSEPRMYSLSYPRQFEILPMVRRRILSINETGI